MIQFKRSVHGFESGSSQGDILEVDELNIQNPWSVSMEPGHVIGALLVPLITIALCADFWFNSI